MFSTERRSIVAANSVSDSVWALTLVELLLGSTNECKFVSSISVLVSVCVIDSAVNFSVTKESKRSSNLNFFWAPLWHLNQGSKPRRGVRAQMESESEFAGTNEPDQDSMCNLQLLWNKRIHRLEYILHHKDVPSRPTSPTNNIIYGPLSLCCHKKF